MKLFSRTITFNEKEFAAEIERLEKRFDLLEERYEGLDDAIRDALDFLMDGRVKPEIARDILNGALEAYGAQLYE